MERYRESYEKAVNEKKELERQIETVRVEMVTQRDYQLSEIDRVKHEFQTDVEHSIAMIEELQRQIQTLEYEKESILVRYEKVHNELVSSQQKHKASAEQNSVAVAEMMRNEADILTKRYDALLLQEKELFERSRAEMDAKYSQIHMKISNLSSEAKDVLWHINEIDSKYSSVLQTILTETQDAPQSVEGFMKAIEICVRAGRELVERVKVLRRKNQQLGLSLLQDMPANTSA